MLRGERDLGSRGDFDALRVDQIGSAHFDRHGAAFRSGGKMSFLGHIRNS